MYAVKWGALLLATCLLLCALSGCEDKSGTEDNITGSLASFTARTLDGGTFTQDDILSKDVTIINFWGTFCSPCIAEMPALAAYAKALPEHVQLITVCTDGAGDPAGAKEILDKAGFTGVTLISGDGDLASLVGTVEFVPTTVLVDSQGQVTGSLMNAETDPAALAEKYTKAVNEVLRAGGKDEITVDVG